MTQPERVLDWVSEHDPRSRAFPAIDLLDELPRKHRTWRAGPLWLDQGTEGACVGFASAQKLAASPFRRKGITSSSARSLYLQAKDIDEWEGNDYEGTSVLAGAKAARDQGLISGYRWVFGVDQLREVVLGVSGAVIGIPWLDSMFRPRPSGLLDCTGSPVGGHAIFVRGFHSDRRLTRDGRGAMFTVRNSWGEDWGVRGDAYIREAELGPLLSHDGEACVFLP